MEFCGRVALDERCLVQALSETDCRKGYDPLVLRKLNPEQATLFLVGHAYAGHEGAREMLELLFPEPENCK
jgi:hypothetical protein